MLCDDNNKTCYVVNPSIAVGLTKIRSVWLGNAKMSRVEQARPFKTVEFFVPRNDLTYFITDQILLKSLIKT